MQVSQMKQKKYENTTVVSLFTCGMGMDRGFEESGFQTVFANDITKFALIASLLNTLNRIS